VKARENPVSEMGTDANHFGSSSRGRRIPVRGRRRRPKEGGKNRTSQKWGKSERQKETEGYRERERERETERERERTRERESFVLFLFFPIQEHISRRHLSFEVAPAEKKQALGTYSQIKGSTEPVEDPREKH
jgi:hypothetical protein